MISLERIPGPLAPVYEKAARLAIETYYRPTAEEITARFNAGLLLDIGAGPGYLPIEIARRLPAARVVCLDLSRQLIQRARRNAQSAGVADRLEFIVGHAAVTPFEDDRFDMVISTGVLHSLRDPQAFFFEVRRVLKKNAQAWVYDPARVSGHIDVDRWKKSLTLRERFFLWLFKRIRIYKEATPLKKRQVEKMLVKTDFDGVDIETTRHEIRIRLQK
jgi:ubiquinone/menaquinone biosynthesis C-methylase UbiE